MGIRMIFGRSLSLGLASAGALVLAGCAGLQMQETSGPAQVSVEGVSLQGIVHGGNLPITGAVIQLYAAGTTGYGSAATALIPVADQAIAGNALTTTGGTFNITGDYTCPSASSQMYLTATGGNPGLSGSVNNTDIAMIAALGSCGNLSSSTTITINEVTTVAALDALQQFVGYTAGTTLAAQPGINSSGVTSTPAFTIGTSSGNAQGLATAFNIAYLLGGGTSGISPTGSISGPVGGSATKFTVDYPMVNLVANILAYCVNSDQTASSNCSTLFGATATLGGAAPVDTLQAAYAIVTNPGYNTSFSTGLPSYEAAAGAPFSSSLTAINDFSIQVIATPSTTVGKYVNNAVDLEFDSYGNLWTANTCHGGSSACSGTGNVATSEFVTEFDGLATPLGTPITQYNTGSISSPALATMTPAYSYANQFTMAVDTSNNVWVADYTDNAIFRIPGSTGYGVASSGITTPANNIGLALGTSFAPSGIAVDTYGNVWFNQFGAQAGGTIGGWAAADTFPTSNIHATAVLVPGSSLPNGPLSTSSAHYASLNATEGAQDTYNTVVDVTPSSTYPGAPFVFVNDGKNNTYGQLHQFFSAAGSDGSTTWNLAAETPVAPFADVELTSTSLRKTTLADAPTVVYNSTSYTPYATKGAVTEAIDGNDNLWMVNILVDSATSTFPLNSLSKLNFTYGTNGSTGALTVAATSTVFTSASLAVSEASATTSNISGFVKIDGGNNVWLAALISSPIAAGNWMEFNNSGTELSSTAGGYGFVGATLPATQTHSNSGHRGMAIDAAGNLWTSSTATNADAFYILVGLAVPTVNPIALATYNSVNTPAATYGRVGTRP